MNFLSGSIQVGRLFDITIRIHVLFLLYLGVRLFEAVQGGEGWVHEALFLGLLFGIVLMHEFGHCLGARAVGGEAHDILMWPLGGLAYAHAPMRPWPQFVTVAAGPLVNVVLCLISGGILVVATGTLEVLSLNPFNSVPYRFHEAWMNFLAVFYEVNYFLLAFNLLPIYPLDGGQIFQAIMWPLLGLQRATVLACQVGLVGCAIFGYLGIRHGGGMLFFIAIFGGMTCWQRLQAARQGLLIEEAGYDYAGRREGGFWRRLFGSRRRRTFPEDGFEEVPRARGSGDASAVNPNPGGWEARQADRAAEEAELDRILRKVSEGGIQSLSYVERQWLERVTRERQREEDNFRRGAGV